MNRALLAILKSVFVAALAVSAAAQAVEAQKPAKADAAKGETIYTNGDTARNIPACVSCHGAAGNSTIAQNPKLAAQHDAYTYKQLVDFRGPARANPIMTPISKALTDEEMKNISAYLDNQALKPASARNKDTIELGKKIYRGGIAEKNVPACASCHSASGAGMAGNFARIGGQHQEYTAAQLTAFRSGTRKNNPIMTTISKRLSDEEIQAVSDYVAGLR